MKRPKTTTWAKLSLVPLYEVRQIERDGRTTYAGLVAVWRNHFLVAQVFDTGEGVTHIVVRTADGTRPTWDHMQRVKDQIAGREAIAIEVHPHAAAVVDVAPLYHLWVLPPEHVLPLRLGRVDAERRP